jgi:hypothetical protein
MEENAMNDSIQTAAIMSAGMKLLRENLGLIESEIFMYNVKQERFDYTPLFASTEKLYLFFNK